jgi:hypothetical protein
MPRATAAGWEIRSNDSVNWRYMEYVIRRAMITHEVSIRISMPPRRPRRHAFPNTGPGYSVSRSGSRSLARRIGQPVGGAGRLNDARGGGRWACDLSIGPFHEEARSESPRQPEPSCIRVRLDARLVEPPGERRACERNEQFRHPPNGGYPLLTIDR